MLAPRLRLQPPGFPFDRPGLEYFYLARNGIYALMQSWGLAGEEVLAPAYCHGVEIQALRHAGARVVYYPVHGRMQVHAEDVISRITPRTKLVYLIHYAGFPGPVEELAVYCREKRILLVEDCALALFSSLGDVPLGSFGDAAVFCLYKTLPLPNGGAVLVNNGGARCRPASRGAPWLSTLAYTASALLRRGPETAGAEAGREGVVARVRAAARPRLQNKLAKVGANTLEARDLGLGMSSLCHWAIAAQDRETIAGRRRRNYQHLLSRLQGVASLVFPELPPGVCPLFFPIQTPHKMKVQEALQARGIESVNLWSFDAPGVRRGEYPETDCLRRTVLELPCHQDLSPETIERIANEVGRLRPLL